MFEFHNIRPYYYSVVIAVTEIIRQVYTFAILPLMKNKIENFSKWTHWKKVHRKCKDNLRQFGTRIHVITL